MKTHFLLAILHCALSLSAQSHITNQERYSKIAIENPDKTTIAMIQSMGIDLACGSHISVKDGVRFLEVECSQTELHAIVEQGINHSILIPDVEQFYSQRTMANLDQAKDALYEQKRVQHQRSSGNVSCLSPEFPVPAHFMLGDLGGFLYYEQILETLDSMATLYPHLISTKKPLSDSIQTRQGRPVYWVRISDHAKTDESEPEVLYTALTHAREPAGAMSLLYYMWYLLENYDSDPEVQRIVDHTEMYFIPVVNPDGYLHNEGIAPLGGGMWRKNLHDNDANKLIDGKDGVDLNRNFGYLWGLDDQGSSPDPALGTYRGECAFSEPETRMIRDFVLQHEFVTAMNDHSYGNDLYHAWEHGPSPLPDADVLYRLSDLMTWNNRFLFGESHSTYWLGFINGGANDWFYGEQTLKPKIFSWLPEIAAAFWPDPLDIVKICSDQVAPHMLVAKVAGQHAMIHNLNPSIVTFGANTLIFRIENLGLTQGEFKLTVIPVSEGISDFIIQDEGIISLRETLETTEVNIDISVDRSVADGSEIEFDLLLEGEHYPVAHLRFSAVVNSMPLVKQDATAGILGKWQTDNWGITTDPINPDVIWLTDSPDGSQLNALSTIQLIESVDLQDISWAKVSFLAKWNIETTHDFVQFQARANGGEWLSLCGRYTKRGAIGNEIAIPSPFAGQPVGQPVYDGRQAEWVQEEFDLSDFVGMENVEFRFVAWSGGKVSLIVEDGFYFTNFNVYTSRKVHCSDHLQNADEEGVDCGGSDCAECPTCEDGILNGNEQGVDCGGDLCAACPTCDDGIQNSDEQGIDCGGTVCLPCITCSDGIQNGSETGIDCGGECDACPPTCSDGVMNGDETGVDCGGALCDPCISCSDGLQNGNETGVDCGGNCVACAPTCDDGILNGDEENIDCGGSCPDVCKTYCCESDINTTWYHIARFAVNISPNPVSGQLSIRARSEENSPEDSHSLFWEIMDMRGVHISEGNMRSNAQTTIDVSTLVPQLYLIRISDANGGLVVQRFLKVD